MDITRPPSIVWFREDLRLSDHPALAAAVAAGGPVLCVYVHDDESAGLRPAGGASRWWLHHSLAALSRQLEARGGRLDILRGPGDAVIEDLARAAGATKVFWARRYEAATIAIDTRAKERLRDAGIAAESFNGRLLYEPWTVKSGAGTPFRVFTPFWRAARATAAPGEPLPTPARVSAAVWPEDAPARVTLDSLGLLHEKPDWAGGLRAAWTPGEDGARARLAAFIDNGLDRYARDRDRPDLDGSSRLSPHLRFGEISPRQIAFAVRHAEAAGKVSATGADKLMSEIGWREFSYHLLFHWPDLATRNFQPAFDAFPWRAPKTDELRAWQRGRTGYPIVDAGMRELWRTGTMHNRVRMICASFLVKDLLVDWRLGEEWFWDTLCDADPASNPASWQWVAGSGADAAPFFRVFNPVLQGEKFDPAGDYVRAHVPELARLDAAWIHKPWLAPASVLKATGVVIGADYPAPIVDHAAARARALAALASIRGGAATD